MKEDAPAPDAVPRKRRQIEAAPDLWLRQWLNREDLRLVDRANLERELDRRREDPRTVVVGVVFGQEGVTPEQLRVMRSLCQRPDLLAVHAPFKIALGVENFITHERVGIGERLAGIVRVSTLVIAAPKESEKPQKVEGVWAAIRLAKTRSLPVTVIMPSGKEVT